MELFDWIRRSAKSESIENAQVQQTPSASVVQDNMEEELDDILSPSKKIDEEW